MARFEVFIDSHRSVRGDVLLDVTIQEKDGSVQKDLLTISSADGKHGLDAIMSTLKCRILR